MEENNQRNHGKIEKIRIKSIKTKVYYEDGTKIDLDTYRLFGNGYTQEEKSNNPELGKYKYLSKYEEMIGTVFGDYSVSAGRTKEGRHNINYFVNYGLDINIVNILCKAGELNKSDDINKQIYQLLYAYKRVCNGEELKGDKELLSNILEFRLTDLDEVKLKEINENGNNLDKKDYKIIKEEIRKAAFESKARGIISDFSTMPPKKRESFIEKFRNLFSKKSRKAALGVALGAATIGGIAGAISTTNPEPAPDLPRQEVSGTVEPGVDKVKDEVDKFREGIKVKDIKETFDEFETINELEAYIKNLYVEEYEKTTGDNSLTTADIHFSEPSSQDYINVIDNGDYVSHGETPDLTRKKIEDNGNTILSYLEEKTLYRVKANGNVIDSVIVIKDGNGNPCTAKVIPGEEFTEMKKYESTAEKLNMIIPKFWDVQDKYYLAEEVKTDFADGQYKKAKNDLAEMVEQYLSRENIKESPAEENIKENPTNEIKMNEPGTFKSELAKNDKSSDDFDR